ncbi:hypothetical protein FWG86_00070 [Candidatus Saccharibacteria bacterium]|nr:hypothetical protein [Candidatus Saccharibacteria bacterium]
MDKIANPNKNFCNLIRDNAGITTFVFCGRLRHPSFHGFLLGSFEGTATGSGFTCSYDQHPNPDSHIDGTVELEVAGEIDASFCGLIQLRTDDRAYHKMFSYLSANLPFMAPPAMAKFTLAASELLEIITCYDSKNTLPVYESPYALKQDFLHHDNFTKIRQRAHRVRIDLLFNFLDHLFRSTGFLAGGAPSQSIA